jgi:hypothetical protein
MCACFVNLYGALFQSWLLGCHSLNNGMSLTLIAPVTPLS